MAYNYNPYMMNPVYPQQQNIIQQNQSNSGFVSVRSESEARSYPVAYGNSVTFKDENAPYIYTKTMGFSQLETPKFDKYKLVKESVQDAPQTEEKPKVDNDVANKLQSEIEAIWKEIEALKKKPVPTPKKGSE